MALPTTASILVTPSTNVSAWLATASRGYCAETNDREAGDCSLGDQGAFGLSAAARHSWPAAAAECLARCAACPRCRHVSLSLAFADCSWYHSCPRLKRRLEGFLSAAARGVHAAPPPRRRRRARRELRAALRLGGPWPWLSPPRHASVALLLCGKIGSLHDPSSWLAARDADARVPPIARASFDRFVRRANAFATITPFVHAWNPALCEALRAAWRPAWLGCERERQGVPPAHSFALSIGRALAAKRAHEAARRARFDLVLLLRHDLLFFAPLRFDALPRAQLWLPSSCCSFAPEAAEAAESQLGAIYPVVRRACFGRKGRVLEMCRTSHYLNMVGEADAMSDEAEYNYFVNDWMLLAPSETADSLGAIGDNFSSYRAALREAGILVDWAHFYFAAHVHHALRIGRGMRPMLHAGVDFNLIRLSGGAKNSLPRDCITNYSVRQSMPSLRGAVWPGMRGLCPFRGQVACQGDSIRCALGEDILMEEEPSPHSIPES
ncbi:hypothetical protein AB1Y20_001676 [Prymnesium parvum]|uniref:Protein xylosyltransferase n=1 Tax=Prymnesium parvum TaxID=97485 RepID=A0AB34K8F1_PRYPA